MTIPSPSRAATVRSVAKDAGVSVASVSRVMAGLGGVSPQLKERVLASAERLGYQPNPLAQSLALGSSRHVAVVAPDLYNPYFYDIIRGIGRACTEDGFTMTVADAMSDEEREAELAAERLRQSDAMILIAPRQELAGLRRLSESRKPVISLLGPSRDTGLRNLAVDNQGGMTQIYEHLAGLGHRDVVYLSGPDSSSQDKLRQQAIGRAEELGMRVTVVAAGGGIEDGYRITDQALRHQPSAIAAYNDLLAFGVLSRLQERGISVPQEVSLTGFDGIEYSRFTSPRLTTVETPRDELGRRGWEAVRAVLTGQGSTDREPLEGRLVIGGSTAAPQVRG